MRRICGVLLVMLLMLTPLLVTDAGAMELGDVDVVWAGWEQDTGPPVVVVDGDKLFTSYQSESVNVENQPPAVRNDNLGVPIVSQIESTDAHKPTASLSDGTDESGRTVPAWRVGEARAG